METNEIKNIINDTLTETVRETILSEQSNVVDKINIFNEQEDVSVENFETISNFEDFISKVVKLDNGLAVVIDGIDGDEFVNRCGVGTSTEAESHLIKGIHNDLETNGVDGDHDIQVDIGSNGNLLKIIIKIMSGEKLGEEMKEDIKPENEKNKTSGKCGDLDECGETEIGEGQEQCDECGKKHKKEKKFVTLKESELFVLIKKIVVESGGVPGITVTKDVTDQAGKFNKEYMTSVDKKMKDYLKFDDNSNPEFPHQNNGEKKVGHENTSEDDEFVDNNRGGGMQDLDYDTEPTEEFVERVKKSLEGDSTMGNSSDPKETGNTIETDTGKEISKKATKRKEVAEKEPWYKKERVPVTQKEVALSEDIQPEKVLTEEEKKKEKIINEDIQRIKEMYGYDEKTQ